MHERLATVREPQRRRAGQRGERRGHGALDAALLGAGLGVLEDRGGAERRGHGRHDLGRGAAAHDKVRAARAQAAPQLGHALEQEARAVRADARQAAEPRAAEARRAVEHEERRDGAARGQRRRQRLVVVQPQVRRRKPHDADPGRRGGGGG